MDHKKVSVAAPILPSHKHHIIWLLYFVNKFYKRESFFKKYTCVPLNWIFFSHNCSPLIWRWQPLPYVYIFFIAIIFCLYTVFLVAQLDFKLHIKTNINIEIHTGYIITLMSTSHKLNLFATGVMNIRYYIPDVITNNFLKVHGFYGYT